MSHKISITEDGIEEAYYATIGAWHGLGTVTEEALSSSGAIKMAHLDWDVLQSDMHFSPVGKPFKKANNFIANYRSDNSEILGVVSERYSVVQNSEAFDFMDTLLQTGQVKYESAGALKNGRIVWILARIPGDIIVGNGDVTRKYMLLHNSHDGTKAVRVSPTNVRVVCWNTLQVAINQKDNAISIRHNGNVKDKLRDAQRVLHIVNKGYDDFAVKAQILSQRSINDCDVKRFIATLEPDMKNPTDKDLKNLDRRRLKIRNYFNAEAQCALEMNEEITAWTLLNAATAHNTHGKKGRSNPEKSFESCFIGSGAKQSQIALDKAMAMFA